MHEFLRMSGSSLAKHIREQDVRAREVIDVHIEYTRSVNPRINALVEERFGAARREADQADAFIREHPPEEYPAFLGVPCTIKESYQVTRMPNSAGLYTRRHIRSKTDAITVQRMRSAGLLPLGVTNTSELCMWVESNNPVYGRTNNPYDPSRIVGGSSGGEGAIIGVGASPIGLGSDIGGSIRNPAFFNGIFGHKPTAGLIPNAGQFPLPDERADAFLCTGPMCRKAEDLMPILRILHGSSNPNSKQDALGDPSAVDLSKIRVLNVLNNGLSRVSTELTDAQDKAASYLTREHQMLETKTYPELKRSFDIWSSMLGQASSKHSFRTMLGYTSKRQILQQLGYWLLGKGRHTLPTLVLALLENLDKHFDQRAQYFIEQGEQLRASLLEDLDENTVLLYPSYTQVAPPHNQTLRSPFHWVYTGIVNMLGFPATQVPLGLNRQGLPLGVQVIARPGNDHLCIAVACELERAFGGWVAPPIRNTWSFT